MNIDMKRVLLIILLAIATTMSVAAPKSMSKCLVGLPTEFNNPLIKESTAKAVLNKIKQTGVVTSSTRYWIAYSDREGNATYSEPSLSSPKVATLGFKEIVRIAKIEKGFAYIYKEVNQQVSNLMISSDAEFLGWIPLDNLLLWSSCLTTEDGIYNKALLCVNLDKASSNTQGIGIGYDNPITKKNRVRLSTEMEFYFIMKRTNGMALLARQTRLDVGKYDKAALFAWVPETSFVPWNQRSCLEPTWNVDDAEHFADKGLNINIHPNKKELSAGSKPVSHIEFKRRKYKAGTPEEHYAYRMPGGELRFPILDGTSDQVYEISTFTTTGNRAINAEPEKNEIDEKKEATLKKMLNINLAIVIDGTQSMQPYYSAVKDAIKKGCEFFSTDNKIKVGVVIYRDYADGVGLTEVMPFTSVRNIERIDQFLENGGKYGIKSSSKDLSKEEALYYGMNVALDSLRFRDGESNMMLVVGDCGNAANDNKISQEMLINKIVDKKISLMGFQVQNEDDTAYSAFNNQMLRIIRQSLLKQYHKLDATIKITPIENPEHDNYIFKANVSDNFYFGNFHCATINNKIMNPSKLTELMSDEISTFSKTVDQRIKTIYNANSVGFISSNRDPGLINVDSAYVKSMLGNDYFENIKDKGAVLNFKGYTNKEIDGRKCFKPVVFLSKSEFDNLLKRLSGLYNAAKSGNYDNREPFIKAMKATIRAFLPNITDQELGSLNNNEITAIIGGLHESSDILKSRYTIDQLAEPQSVRKEVYMSIVKDFKNKYENLDQINKSNTYKYIKEFNGERYYWIPVTELP